MMMMVMVMMRVVMMMMVMTAIKERLIFTECSIWARHRARCSS